MGVRHGRCAVVRRLHSDRPGYRIRGTRCLPALVRNRGSRQLAGCNPYRRPHLRAGPAFPGQWILYQRAQRRRSDRPALIFAITSALGWRSAFFVLGGGGVLWFSVWVLSTASPKLEPVWHDDPREGDAPKEKLARIIVQIIRSPRFLPVLVVAVLINPCLYFSVNWLPTYFAQQHGLLPGSQLGWILTAIYLGVGVGNFLCGAGVLTLTRRGRPLAAARRTVFLLATVPLSICAAVPLMRLSPAVFALVAVNIGLGIWVAMYLTMVQDVSAAHVSTALGLLSGCGSLAGAVAMWAVGRVTQHTHSFALPMAAFSVSAVISAIAGWAASRETSLKGGTV